MRKREIIVPVILSLFLTFACYSYAQPISDTTGKIGIGLRVNGMTTTSDTYKGRDIDKKDQAMFGVSLSYGVNSWLSLEAAFDGSLNTKLKDNTLGIDLATINVYPLTFSAQLRYITKNPEFYNWIVPYLTFGFGYYFVSGDVSSEYKAEYYPNDVKLDFDGGWGGHVGIGTDIFASKTIAVGFEARYFWASGSIKETITNPILNASTTHKENFDLDSWMLGINIKFFFK